MMAQAQITAFAPHAGMAMPIPWTRQAERLPVRMRACCRTRSGFRDDVVITDLSTGGCRIESRSTTLRPGDLVLVRPEGLEGQPGVVCWVERNCVGIKFERPLYGPVVEHICQKHTMM